MAPTTMQALQLARDTPATPPKLHLTTLPIPTLPPKHLLIHIHASAIHPSDILNSRGGFKTTTFPRVPGRDFSGIVIDGPPSRIGEEVFGTSGYDQGFTTDGAHAEYIIVPENGVAKKPTNLTWAQAAVIGVPFTTACLMVRKAGVKEGETVLVLGANGSVGRAVCQLAACAGARVLRGVRGKEGDVDTDEVGLKGVDDLAGGKGVDVVTDTVGDSGLTRAAVGKLGRGGRLVFIAAPRGGASTELGIDMLDFYRKEKVLLGVNSLLYGVEEMAEIMQTMSKSFEEGVLDGSGPGEWTEFKLKNGVEAYEKGGQRGGGKYVLLT